MQISVRVRAIASLAVVTAFLLGARWAGAEPASVTGRWEATVVVNGVEIPFRFEIATAGGVLAGSFFNGERRITSTSGRAEGERLRFAFDQYAAELEATIDDGKLVGEYRRGARVAYPFKATRAGAARPGGADRGAPSLEGTWIVPAKSSKGETAWRFVARQQDGVVSASILRVDGDTGTLTGSYRDGRYVLSHFSGARPLLLEVTPQPDGSLLLRQNGKTELTAVRESDARAAALGLPTDPSRHTTVADPSEPFRFSFPDMSGRVVSNTDAQFAGKVVLVNISGSWCPNCHDEAPFLASIYRKYRAQGLKVVTLSFEDGDQLVNPTRLRAFVATYGLEHTVLLAGNPDDLNAKVPQAVNLNAFPTTFILGRDGRVRGVHAGFPSQGSGEFYVKAEQDITREIEHLLAERVGSEQ
jgi:thiol-disulfide isomerase/thioredoxin